MDVFEFAGGLRLSAEAAVLIGAGLTLATVAASLFMFFIAGRRKAARLAAAGRSAHAGAGADPMEDRLARWFGPLQASLGPKDPKYRGALRKRLVRAGFFNSGSVEAYYAARVAAAAAVGALAIALHLFVLPPMGPVVGMAIVLASAAVGLYLPNLIVHLRIKEREAAFRLGLPDALDMMVVCVEAGASLNSAFSRTAREMADVHPVISEQFRATILEMGAGVGRATALKRMGERIAVDEVRAMVTLLVQSEELGASLAQTLRVYGEEMRRNRLLEAEQKAAELPVKLAIPLVLCIFPSLMSVIMTPMVIRLVRVLLPIGDG
jgi:tight adherence protein C